MTKRRRSLLAKVFGIGPKPASKRRRPELPETSDEAELRKYIRRLYSSTQNRPTAITENRPTPISFFH